MNCAITIRRGLKRESRGEFAPPVTVESLCERRFDTRDAGGRSPPPCTIMLCRKSPVGTP